MQIVERNRYNPSGMIHSAYRSRFLVLTCYVLTAFIAACGRSPRDLKAQVTNAANNCIKIDTVLTPSIRDCLRSEAPFTSFVATATGKSMRVCYPAKGTIGKMCGYLEIDLDSAGRITAWRAESSLEE